MRTFFLSVPNASKKLKFKNLAKCIYTVIELGQYQNTIVLDFLRDIYIFKEGF